MVEKSMTKEMDKSVARRNVENNSENSFLAQLAFKYIKR